MEKSKVEGPFRDYLVSDFEGSQSNTAQLLSSKMMRSADKNKQHFARHFLKDAERKPLHTKGGIFLGNYFQAKLRTDFVNEAISWIVRGLYWINWKKPMPASVQVHAFRLGIEDYSSVNPFRKENGLSDWFRLEDVCAVSGSYAVDDKDCSVWFIVFYERVAYKVLCGKEEDFEKD